MVRGVYRLLRPTVHHPQGWGWGSVWLTRAPPPSARPPTLVRLRLSCRLPPEMQEAACARAREGEVDGEVLSTLSLGEVREVRDGRRWAADERETMSKAIDVASCGTERGSPLITHHNARGVPVNADTPPSGAGGLRPMRRPRPVRVDPRPAGRREAGEPVAHGGGQQAAEPICESGGGDGGEASRQGRSAGMAEETSDPLECLGLHTQT